MRPKRTSKWRNNDLAGVLLLIFLLIILPVGFAYVCVSIFRFPIWLSIILGILSSILILLILIFLLGATFRLPDHLPPDQDYTDRRKLDREIN